MLSLTSLRVGYRLGGLYAHCSRSCLDLTTYPKEYGEAVPMIEEEKEDVKRDDDDEGIPDGDLSSIKAGIMEGCKVVRFFHIESTNKGTGRGDVDGNIIWVLR